MKLKLFPFSPKGLGLQTTEDSVNSFLLETGVLVSQVQVLSAEGETCLALLCEDAPQNISHRSVDVLCLSGRPRQVLACADITTLDQLCRKTESELLKYRNFGKKALNEIKDKLAKLDLELGRDYSSERTESSS